jgi:hypothetical protein
MTNFEKFQKECEQTEQFAYLIYFKDGKFECRKNDSDYLLAVNEDDILYFQGTYQMFDFDDGMFEFIDAGTEQDPSLYEGYGWDFMQLSEFFSYDIAYKLSKKGIPKKQLNKVCDKLYDFYLNDEEFMLHKDDYSSFIKYEVNYLLDVKKELQLL